MTSGHAHFTMYRTRSKVVYDRRNGSILRSTKLSSLTPVSFDNAGLFKYYDAIYGLANITDNSTRTHEVETTIRYHILFQAGEYLKGDVGVDGAEGDEDQYWRHFAILSMVLEPYENALNSITDVLYTSASTATQQTRVTIPREHLIGFGIITTFSLMWWLTMMRLLVRSKVVTPNGSLYPEIDFGSKCLQEGRGDFEQRPSERVEGLSGVLMPLSNATSTEILKEIDGVRLHLGAKGRGGQYLPRIILTTNVNEVEELVAGKKYS